MKKFSNSCNSIKFLWANHYFIKFSCRDINAKLKLYAVIKLRAKFKTAQLANFLLCRDIKLLVATYSAFGGISHPLAVTANIPSMCYDVATTSSKRNLLFVAT